MFTRVPKQATTWEGHVFTRAEILLWEGFDDDTEEDEDDDE